MTEPGTAKRKPSVTERQRKALQLRKAGVGYADIARQCGYASASGAHKAVHAARSRGSSVSDQEAIETQEERLDVMIMGLWPAASKGDPAAVRAVVFCEARRAKLRGLDATATTVTVAPETVPVEDEVDEVRQARARRRGAL